MRLDDTIKNFLKQSIGEKIPGAKVFLFGSRTDYNALGGDIDVLIMIQTPRRKKIFRAIKVEFFKKFGWQKIDLVNFTFDDTSFFKQLMQDQAIEIE